MSNRCQTSPSEPERKRPRTTYNASEVPSNNAEPIQDEEYGRVDDPALVTGPVKNLVHEKLLKGWNIRPDHHMWFIFDSHTPACHFKRGTLRQAGATPPTYDPQAFGDLTDTDIDPPGWMPFAPQTHRSVYRLKCDISGEGFMSWTKGELREIMVGRSVTTRKGGKRHREDIYRTTKVPAPYDRVVAQLIAEDAHANGDKSHDSLCRQTYARRVLDAFWYEINQYNGKEIDFRSAVLTPILQRQLRGVEDSYGPSVRAAVGDGCINPTIAQATEFYLGDDPTSPYWIPCYRRNLIYVPEARWHLGVVLGKYRVTAADQYRTFRDNQLVLDKWIRKRDEMRRARREAGEAEAEEKVDEGRGKPVPNFGFLEVFIIINEQLEDFFGPELTRVPWIVDEARKRLDEIRMKRDSVQAKWTFDT